MAVLSDRELLEALQLLDVLEPLQVQREHVGQLLDAHALLRLLQRAARVAKELVVAAEGLVRREVAHARRDGRVLLNLERPAVQTVRFCRETARQFRAMQGAVRAGSGPTAATHPIQPSGTPV